MTDDRMAGETSARPDLPTLVSSHHAAVYRYARRLAGCPVQAEDLTQQTFLIAQQKIDQLRDPSRSAAWLLAIARSCFLKSCRRQQPAAAESVGLEIDHIADRRSVPDEIDREALDAALTALPEDFRLVLLMYYFEDLSYQEIAAQLELPLGTVMSRLSRAKGHLRTKLAPPIAEPARAPIRRAGGSAAHKPIPAKAH